jgi:hypothetical protein
MKRRKVIVADAARLASQKRRGKEPRSWAMLDDDDATNVGHCVQTNSLLQKREQKQPGNRFT